MNLNKIRIHFGFPAAAKVLGKMGDYVGIQTLNNATAITIGNDIFFSSRADYNPDSIAGIALIGHEVKHVQQFQAGKFGDAKYVAEYLELRKQGLSDNDAYRNISTEREAFKTQALIHRDLENLKKQVGGDAFWDPCPPN